MTVISWTDVSSWIEQNPMVLVISLASAAAFLLLLVLVLAIIVARSRRIRSHDLVDRSEDDRERIDLALTLAEQTGRLRIVGELHQVVLHDVAVMISQADGARYAAESDPGAAIRAASVIADSARTILADLRRVMTLVGDGEAALASQPQLRSSRDLFKVMEESGLVISFEENGPSFDIKTGAELAIFRILQEALSNSLKHGGRGTEVTVIFTWTDDSFQLRIDDNGTRNSIRLGGKDPNAVSRGKAYSLDEDIDALTGLVSGRGISEMRERVELFGGVLSTTTVPGVGFSVAASFPSLRYNNGVHGINLGA
jgi:signal transduction histidine kinase